jgi:uncharacterized protein YbjT (DUF2867 family)
MKLTVFAATGGIGRHLLEQALAAGHAVTAVVRNPAKLAACQARVVTADLSAPDASALAAAVDGADAVLSGLGPTSKAEVGVAWRGTQAIVAAMKGAGVRRVVAVSAAPIGTVPSPARPHPPKYDPGDGFFTRHLLSPMIKAILREHYADVAHMEDVVCDGALDWTVVRPPRLTDGPLRARYRVAYGQNLPRGLSVSRADVAHFMLAALDRRDTVRETMGIAD